MLGAGRWRGRWTRVVLSTRRQSPETLLRSAFHMGALSFERYAKAHVGTVNAHDVAVWTKCRGAVFYLDIAQALFPDEAAIGFQAAEQGRTRDFERLQISSRHALELHDEIRTVSHRGCLIA